MAYDAVKRHLAIEKLVTRSSVKGLERRYYRFRLDRWYGGIVTADCVGCGLLCRFCWVSDRVAYNPSHVGSFYSPEDVALKLLHMADKSGLRQLRLSGGEPTIGKNHLLRLLELLDGSNLSFILETNGIPIAYDSDYAPQLSSYRFIHVRVSLKGCSENEFAMLTGAKPENYRLQLTALERLIENDVSCHPSVMASFSTKESLKALREKLAEISPILAENLEIEELILYPNVRRKIARYGLRYYTSYYPDNIPPEQI
ncbi:MAG: radical SAM protein [Candidatus Bathyarchaeia archaeon]|nr:radical SAM protein [Candidatus Bathyarchaeota archaeon]